MTEVTLRQGRRRQ